MASKTIILIESGHDSFHYRKKHFIADNILAVLKTSKLNLFLALHFTIQDSNKINYVQNYSKNKIVIEITLQKLFIFRSYHSEKIMSIFNKE